MQSQKEKLQEELDNVENLIFLIEMADKLTVEDDYNLNTLRNRQREIQKELKGLS